MTVPAGLAVVAISPSERQVGCLAGQAARKDSARGCPVLVSKGLHACMLSPGDLSDSLQSSEL